jgi:hypothetical protein
MFDKSLRKSVQPFLDGSEQLLGAVMAQNADAANAAGSAGVKVDRRMVIAVTSRRLLIFRMGGAFTPKAKELLGEAPIGAVEGIDVEPAGLAKTVTLRVRGTAIGIETARGQPAEDLPRALELARVS